MITAAVISTVVQALRLFLALTFATSAATKLRAPRAFAAAVGGYALLPRALVSPIALAVVGGETLTAVGLVAEASYVFALGLAIAFLVAFSVAVSLTLRRGRRIPCGCFNGTSMVSRVTLTRLIVLITVGLALVARSDDPSSTIPLDHPVELVPGVALALALMLAGAWMQHAADLYRLVRDTRIMSSNGITEPRG